LRGKRQERLTHCAMLVIGSFSGVACLQTAGAQAGGGPAPAGAGNSLAFSAGDTFTYDDNLFRLASGNDGSGIGAVSREDHINTVNLGVDGHWFGWRQEVDVSIRAADNRFVRNGSLNNVSGTGKITWDWIISPRLSGTAGYDFARVLASFANTFFFAKDLVDTTDYFATGGLRVTQHWTITSGVKESDASHSAPERRGDEFHSKSGNLGVQYLTTEQNSLGLSYAYTDADFPQPGVLNGVQFDRGYKDSVEQVAVKYQLGGKTQLDARAGYIKRRYPDSIFGSFSGDTWRATLTWVPTGKTQLVLAGWRELTAYLDAESDYFVSKGGSATATWTPTMKIAVSAVATLNSQRYISNSPSTVAFSSRHDNLRTYQVNVGYSPRDLLSLQLGYRYDMRDSNQPQLGYIDKLMLAQIVLRL
jgi:hypothetical protein